MGPRYRQLETQQRLRFARIIETVREDEARFRNRRNDCLRVAKQLAQGVDDLVDPVRNRSDGSPTDVVVEMTDEPARGGGEQAASTDPKVEAALRDRGVDIACVPEIIEVAGKQAEGFISYEMYDFDAPAAQPLVKAYRAKYGAGIINSQTPAFYNATKVLLEAMRRAGTIDDTTKLRDAIEKIEGYDAGVYGPLKWTGKAIYGVDHQIKLPFFIVEVKDGKAVSRATLTMD